MKWYNSGFEAILPNPLSWAVGSTCNHVIITFIMKIGTFAHSSVMMKLGRGHRYIRGVDPCANNGSTKVWGVLDVFKHSILTSLDKKTEKNEKTFPALCQDTQDLIIF